MTRRQYGTGTVFRTKQGRWVGRIEAGWTHSGGRRRLTVIGATEAEAKRKLKELHRAIATEGLPAAAKRK